MDTKAMIEIIKAKFEMIRIVLNDELHLEDLKHSKYLRTLIEATENTYIQLNDSICESLHMCRECAQKRELLMQYINLLDDIENGAEVTPEKEQKLTEYPHAVRGIIERIDRVLREHHS